MVSGSPGLSDQTDDVGFGHRGVRFGPPRRGGYPAVGQLSGEFLCGLWSSACTALEVPADHTVRSTRMVQDVLPSWADERIAATPTRPSYVADDGYPAEMSVNWSGAHPELRLLFDCLGDAHHGRYVRGGAGSPVPAPEPRLAGVHGIFTPSAGWPPAPLWYSVAWRPPARVVHKTYFGLYEWPLLLRYAAVGEAMQRLGMAAAWEHARRWVEESPGRREIEFFAVDRTADATARVKVYYRNHGADTDELNRIASVATHHDADRAHAAYRVLTGDRSDAGEAPLTCLAFRSGLAHVAESTTYLRLSDLAPDDREAVARTAALLRGEGVDPGRFRALATALAPGPLEASRGLLALVSYRAAGRRGDVTTYFRFPVHDRPV